MLSNSCMRDEHAQRFSWLSLLAQNSSMQSKNTVRHLEKSRLNTSVPVVAVAVAVRARVVVGMFGVRDFVVPRVVPTRAVVVARGCVVLRATVFIVRG